MDTWKQRTDDVMLEVDGHSYTITDGKLIIDNCEYERESSEELWALIYAFADLEKAYQEDT